MGNFLNGVKLVQTALKTNGNDSTEVKEYIKRRGAYLKATESDILEFGVLREVADTILRISVPGKTRVRRQIDEKLEMQLAPFQ